MDNPNPPPEAPPSFLIEKKEIDSGVMLIELIKDDEYPSDDELNKDDDVGEEEFEGNHFDKFPTCSELAYHKYLMHDPYLSKIDKLTSGDKSLDLSAFKLSRLFFSLLSSGSSSCWRSYEA
ncbi:hypothetical protein Tco_0947245 [Tanacetum coccineum]